MRLNVPIVKSIFPMQILTVMKANIVKETRTALALSISQSEINIIIDYSKLNKKDGNENVE
jgi:hypothetical protein